MRLLLITFTLLIAGCSVEETNQPMPTTPQTQITTMKLTSPAFEEGASIPARFTCQRDDISPELRISDVPDNAKSLVLVMDDPDAPMGTWDHWLLFNIDSSTELIVENSEPTASKGVNSWGRTGYGGPCPPSGTHRYFFKLYALDSGLDLADGASKQDLLNAMEDHILEEATLMGTYQKQ